MDNTGITLQSIFSSLQLMIAAVSFFLGLYVLLDNYHKIKIISGEKSHAMDVIGWLLIVVSAYRLFFLLTDLRYEMPQFALLITLLFYYVICQFIEISLYNLVGLVETRKSIAGVVAWWIMINAVLFLLPITIMPNAKNYIALTAVILFFGIKLPIKIKRWNNCRLQVIDNVQKATPERMLLTSILRITFIILLLPISGIVLSYLEPSLLPIQFLFTTILYIRLVSKYRNYFLCIIARE